MASVGHFLTHQFVRYRASWTSTLVSSVLFPVLFLLAVGFGIGSQIDDTSTLGTTDYASFLGPGVLAGVAALQAGGLSLWPTLGAIKWEGDYQAALATPITTTGLVIGHVTWIGIRSVVSGVLFVAVLAAFGVADSWTAVLAPVAAGAVAMSIAGVISAWSASQESDDSFGVINRIGLTPTFLFSGAFFPVEQLPEVLGWLSRALPVFHGVELTRGLIIGTLGPAQGAGHAAYLGLWIVVGLLLARRSFTNRLAA